MKIIVLGNSKYKENDLIYNAISEDSSFSFKVCGGQSNKSPCVWLNNPLTIAEVEFGDRRFKHPSLKEAKLIASPMTMNNSLTYLCTISIITEIANKTFPEEDRYLLYRDIIDSVTALKNGKDEMMVLLILMARAAKLAGAELEVNGCVICGKTKGLVAFSFPDGGFVCEDCLKDSLATPSLTAQQMRLIRYIFKAPNYECPASDQFTDEDKNVVLKSMREYFFDYLGVFIESISSIFK